MPHTIKMAAKDMKMTEVCRTYRSYIMSEVYSWSDAFAVIMKRVQPMEMTASDTMSDCWMDSCKKHTESKVLKIIERAHVDERRNWLPTRSATILKTEPRIKLDSPKSHVTVQNTLPFFLAYCAYLSCLTWAYFMRTRPRELKKLPKEARIKQIDVSALLRRFLAVLRV